MEYRFVRSRRMPRQHMGLVNGALPDELLHKIARRWHGSVVIDGSERRPWMRVS